MNKAISSKSLAIMQISLLTEGRHLVIQITSKLQLWKKNLAKDLLASRFSNLLIHYELCSVNKAIASKTLAAMQLELGIWLLKLQLTYNYRVTV